jgi:hypothetical protein
VDNIREIVKQDPEVRNGLLEIHHQKGDNLSPELKGKLYLAGIINYDGNEIKIKNEIIKQSLSLEWLQQIEEEEKGLVLLAYEYFDKKSNTRRQVAKDPSFEEEVLKLLRILGYNM